jgi:hypothetical protein
MAQYETFRATAPGVMTLLMQDFGLDETSAAAILGNLGHESAGFTTLQEVRPTVKGSRGGYGWAQWTGPRRRAFEAYCERNKLSPSSNKANYGFLFTELKGDEKAAIPAVKNAVGLEAKVIAFEKAFLRAGIKHYPSRHEWAMRALVAFKASSQPIPAPIPPVVPPKPPVGFWGALWGILLAVIGLFKKGKPK